jgi:hypothetical protein
VSGLPRLPRHRLKGLPGDDSCIARQRLAAEQAALLKVLTVEPSDSIAYLLAAKPQPSLGRRFKTEAALHPGTLRRPCSLLVPC